MGRKCTPVINHLLCGKGLRGHSSQAVGLRGIYMAPSINENVCDRNSSTSAVSSPEHLS